MDCQPQFLYLYNYIYEYRKITIFLVLATNILARSLKQNLGLVNSLLKNSNNAYLQLISFYYSCIGISQIEQLGHLFLSSMYIFTHSSLTNETFFKIHQFYNLKIKALRF